MTMEAPKLETLQSIIDDPAILLGQIRHFAHRCRAVLEEGGEVDLAGMDAQVQVLCKQVDNMPLAEGLKFRPKLDSLINELDDLAVELENQKIIIHAQLNDLVKQQKANQAYQKVESSVPIAPTEEAQE